MAWINGILIVRANEDGCRRNHKESFIPSPQL